MPEWAGEALRDQTIEDELEKERGLRRMMGMAQRWTPMRMQRMMLLCSADKSSTRTSARGVRRRMR